MSLRLKLIISFVTACLAVVSIFASVAYTSARDYTYHNELTHVHKGNLDLINMLGEHPSLEQIQWMIPKHGNRNYTFNIIDARSKQIIDEKPTTILQEIFAHISSLDEPQQGLFTFNNVNYLWATNPVAGTPYTLLGTFHRAKDKANNFFDFISLSLGISIFVGIWFSLWAATIIANLFERLARQKDQLEHQALHDTLTQLPNRTQIDQIIQQRIQDFETNRQTLCLCLIHMHGLKDINDSLGHESGDLILRLVSDRLKGVAHTLDQVGRFGGNKFALILSRAKIISTKDLCNKILTAFEPVFEVNGHSLFIRATLGLAMYPEHATGSQGLIQKAEVALHKAKEAGKDYAVYDIQFDRNSVERLDLAHDLRNAIRDDKLELYYQPKLDMHHGAIMSVEALCRWTHPTHGFIPPDVFVEIAEHTGLIKPLTKWVLSTAIRQCAQWNTANTPLNISINLSARNLHDEALDDLISGLLQQWHVHAEQISLEITETAMMADPAHARVLLNKFDALGLRISIDDFGTGYSSLGYLKTLPVDEIKIDKSFVLNMAEDENDASIVRATISLAHDLGLDVVAEGVENQAAQDKLQQLGCNYLQGYHIGRPMPNNELMLALAAVHASNDDSLDQAGPINAQPH